MNVELEQLRDRFDAALTAYLDQFGTEHCPYCDRMPTDGTSEVVSQGYVTDLVVRCACGNDYAISR